MRIAMRTWGLVSVGVVVLVLFGCAPYRDVTVGGLETEEDVASPMYHEDDPDPWSDFDRETPAQIRTTVRSYVKSRWLDFWDMFEVGLSGGKGFKLEAQYLIGFWGYGIADVQRWRIGQRAWILNEETTEFATLPFPASLVLFPATVNLKPPKDAIVVLGGISYESESYIWPDPTSVGLPNDQVRVRMACVERNLTARRFVVTPESTAIGAEVHLLIGARARVMPLQILDFIAGLAFVDLLGDDVKPYDPDDQERAW